MPYRISQPRGWTPTTVHSATEAFAAFGYGPTRVRRYERAMSEILEYGPQTFIQRDIARIQKAVQETTMAGDELRARVDALAQKAMELPLEQARNTRRYLQQLAKKAGAELRY